MRLATRMALAMVPLVLLALPASVARADCVTPSGTTESYPASADGSIRTFSGNVTPFGLLTGGLTLHFNPTGTFTGQFTFIARGGGVYGTLTGYFTSPNTYEETLTFTGGTGKYATISGSVEVNGTLNPEGIGTDMVTGGLVCLH